MREALRVPPTVHTAGKVNNNADSLLHSVEVFTFLTGTREVFHSLLNIQCVGPPKHVIYRTVHRCVLHISS